VRALRLFREQSKNVSSKKVVFLRKRDFPRKLESKAGKHVAFVFLQAGMLQIIFFYL
jgi:hypothetical protein